MELKYKHELFCQEYIIDGNGAQSAIRAGYAVKGANAHGSRLLAIDSIKVRIEELRKEIEGSKIATAKEIQELLTERLRVALDVDGLRAVEILNKMQGNYEKDNSQKDEVTKHELIFQVMPKNA